MLRTNINDILSTSFKNLNPKVCIGDRYNFALENIKEYKFISDKGLFLYIVFERNIESDRPVTMSFVPDDYKITNYTLDIDNGCHYLENANFVVKARYIENHDNMYLYKVFQFLNNKE